MSTEGSGTPEQAKDIRSFANVRELRKWLSSIATDRINEGLLLGLDDAGRKAPHAYGPNGPAASVLIALADALGRGDARERCAQCGHEKSQHDDLIPQCSACELIVRLHKFRPSAPSPATELVKMQRAAFVERVKPVIYERLLAQSAADSTDTPAVDVANALFAALATAP